MNLPNPQGTENPAEDEDDSPGEIIPMPPPVSDPNELSNIDRWRQVIRDYPTTGEFELAGWTFLIGAALQRRVWVGGLNTVPIFPNPYYLFVAPPGVGKSLVTSEVKKLLEFHTIRNARNVAEGSRPMFPVCADSTSYESAVSWFSKRGLGTILKPDGKHYTYCCGTFILDEVTSIFHQYADQMSTFLLSGWTAVDSYKRETLGRGVDTIKNLCISLIGGTQPEKLARVSTSEIISNGFIRRCVVVYCGANDPDRKCLLIPRHDDQQILHKAAILKHLAALSKVYGEVTFTPEAQDFLDWWWLRGGMKRLNDSKVLDHYYTSMNLHLFKTAMALHFGETTSMVIPRDTVERALKILQAFERNAHLAFVGESRARANISEQLINRLRMHGKRRAVELYIDYSDIMPFRDFQVLLEDLTTAARIRREGSHYQVNGRVTDCIV